MELNDSLNDSLTINIINNEIFSCPVCLNDIIEDEKCLTNCNHFFCKECLHTWFERNKITCPTCRSNITQYKNNNENHYIIKVNNDENDA